MHVNNVSFSSLWNIIAQDGPRFHAREQHFFLFSVEHYCTRRTQIPCTCITFFSFYFFCGTLLHKTDPDFTHVNNVSFCGTLLHKTDPDSMHVYNFFSFYFFCGTLLHKTDPDSMHVNNVSFCGPSCAIILMCCEKQSRRFVGGQY